MKKDCLETYSAEQDTSTWELQGSLYSRGGPQQKGDLFSPGQSGPAFYTKYMWLCRGFPTRQMGIQRPSKAFRNLPSASKTFLFCPLHPSGTFRRIPALGIFQFLGIPQGSVTFHSLLSYSITFRVLLGVFPRSHLLVPTLLSPFPPPALSFPHYTP